jgi:hypothetical protein
MFPAYENDVPAIEHRDLFQRPGPIPDMNIEGLLEIRQPSVVARSPQSSTSSSASQVTSCGPKDTTGPCERNVSTSATLPIALGVAIPLTVAFVLMIILHRRHVKKLRREDAEDANKSLDFGLDGSPRKDNKKQKKHGRNAPEMSVAEAQGAVRGDRGVSLDLGMGNPYLLPPELKESRESLHSLSRASGTGDDKYRTTSFIPDDGSIRSPSSLRSHWDDSSTTHTGSSQRKMDSESTKGLLPQPPITINEPLPTHHKRIANTQMRNSFLAPGLEGPTRDSFVSTTSSNGAVAALRASNNYLGAFISGGMAKKKNDLPKEEIATSVVELEGSTPVQESPAAVGRYELSERNSTLPDLVVKDFDFNIPSDGLKAVAYEPTTYHDMTTGQESQPSQTGLAPPDSKTTNRRSSIYEDELIRFSQQEQEMNFTEGHSHEASAETETHTFQPISSTVNPQSVNAQEHDGDYYEDEESYNIDEYKSVLGYDARMLVMGQRPLPPDDPTENPEERAIRIRSFYKEYFDDSLKPASGPAARVSYYDGSENYIDDYYGTSSSTPYGSRGPSAQDRAPQGRHRATVSSGAYHGPEPRAYSSASGRMGPRRMPPKKNLPPPAPLLTLPTPSKIQEDSMLPNAIDFAPPQVFKKQRAGTPDSLRGGQQPYSQPTKTFNPLVSSFDDLAVLPSP